MNIPFNRKRSELFFTHLFELGLVPDNFLRFISPKQDLGIVQVHARKKVFIYIFWGVAGILLGLITTKGFYYPILWMGLVTLATSLILIANYTQKIKVVEKRFANLICHFGPGEPTEELLERPIVCIYTTLVMWSLDNPAPRWLYEIAIELLGTSADEVYKKTAAILGTAGQQISSSESSDVKHQMIRQICLQEAT